MGVTEFEILEQLGVGVMVRDVVRDVLGVGESDGRMASQGCHDCGIALMMTRPFCLDCPALPPGSGVNCDVLTTPLAR